MIDVAWNIQEDDPDAELTGNPRPLLGTWHFLRNSLRREWRTWVGLAALGASLGMAAAILMPPSSTATVTLLMAHPASIDGPAAIATDVSLLNTREVAARTVRELGLDLTPDGFQSAITAEPVTTQILTITISGPDDASAVVRADALVRQYLDFRASQMRSLTSGLISGYKTRIAAMQEQVNGLNRQYAQFSELGAAGQGRADEVLAQRAGLNAQISSMQQAIEQETLQTDAAVASTHVVDAAHAVRHSAKRAMVLNVGSGLIGGAALGIGLVLFRALTSDRLRRRQDVALALGAPVRFSVASDGPAERRLGRLRQRLWARLPWRRVAAREGPWRGRDLQALVSGLGTALTPHPGAADLAKPPAEGATTAGSSGATPGGSSGATPGAAAAGTSAGLTGSKSAKSTSAAISPSPRRSASARATIPDSTGTATSRQPVRSQARRQSRDGVPPGGETGAPSVGRARNRAGGGRRSGAPNGVALASIGNARAAANVVSAAASHLRGLGLSVFLVDLSSSGTLISHASAGPAPVDGEVFTESALAVGSAGGGRTGPVPGVFRPTGIPGLARGPRGAVPGAVIDLPVGDPRRGGWDAADVVLALVEVDPGIDVENLRSWVGQVVPLVSAGRSTAELLETTAELIRTAGLSLPFAMMVGSDASDESLGLVDPAAPEAAVSVR